jgi:hypothetical protein
VERCVGADTGSGVDVRAGVDKHLSNPAITTLGGPMQRRHTIALRGIDVSTLLKQFTYRLGIASHRRLGDRRT